MTTPICKYYDYGHCDCHSGFVGKGAHLLFGCPYENENGFPSAIKQKRHCKDYKPEED